MTIHALQFLLWSLGALIATKVIDWLMALPAKLRGPSWEEEKREMERWKK